MHVTTTLSFEGYRITEYKGIVRGIIVRPPTIGQGIMGGLKSIIGMHDESAGVGGGWGRHATEIMACGTAVVIEPIT